MTYIYIGIYLLVGVVWTTWLLISQDEATISDLFYWLAGFLIWPFVVIAYLVTQYADKVIWRKK